MTLYFINQSIDIGVIFGIFHFIFILYYDLWMKKLLWFAKFLPLIWFFALFTFFWWCNMEKVVESWDLIVVDYVWKHLDWTVFDTSVKSIAEESWIYNPNRDYEAWLEFTAWSGQMIKWFDEAVIWMKVGESKTVEIPAEKAYGERNEDYVLHVPLAEAGDISWAEVGMQVILWGYIPAKIVDINDEEIVYDANHELAWETLVFDITIKSIQK